MGKSIAHNKNNRLRKDNECRLGVKSEARVLRDNGRRSKMSAEIMPTRSGGADAAARKKRAIRPTETPSFIKTRTSSTYDINE